MKIEEIEAEALKLSIEGTARLWNAEAERRNEAWSVSDSARSSDDVFRDARKRPRSSGFPG
jgi:hypothetical protein